MSSKNVKNFMSIVQKFRYHNRQLVKILEIQPTFIALFLIYFHTFHYFSQCQRVVDSFSMLRRLSFATPAVAARQKKQYSMASCRAENLFWSANGSHSSVIALAAWSVQFPIGLYCLLAAHLSLARVLATVDRWNCSRRRMCISATTAWSYRRLPLTAVETLFLLILLLFPLESLVDSQ